MRLILNSFTISWVGWSWKVTFAFEGQSFEPQINLVTFESSDVVLLDELPCNTNEEIIFPIIWSEIKTINNTLSHRKYGISIYLNYYV